MYSSHGGARRGGAEGLRMERSAAPGSPVTGVPLLPLPLQFAVLDSPAPLRAREGGAVRVTLSGINWLQGTVNVSLPGETIGPMMTTC